MGLRSWVTPAYTYTIFNQLVKNINKNPNSYGINFIIKLKKDSLPFEKGQVLIAWNGDGNSSLDYLKPVISRNYTQLLDNLNVKFQKNPNAIGDLIFNEELILRELFNEFEDRYHMLKNIERLNSK
jgi:hypothetical protein